MIEFKASISKCRQIDGSDEIEYVLEFTNLEGYEKWKLTKRYSEFVVLNNKIWDSIKNRDELQKLP